MQAVTELLKQTGGVVRIGIQSMKANMKTPPQAATRASEAELGDYCRVVRTIETADGEGAAMSQVLARAASIWMEEAV